jgi:aerobic-type carbon monoxide dehydrogenase small subunit (CoxS/CutS family)
MMREISLEVNGQQRTTQTDEERPLLDVLREDWQLTGTKYGCGEGACGACTVLVDGTATRSCITPISSVEGQRIETIEGLAGDRDLHPVQAAFVDQQAMQCGYCIPGHIMTAVALVRNQPQATRETLVAALSEHICRCCNYPQILAAVEQVLQARSEEVQP